MQRTIEHADHQDVEQLIDGVWAVVKCNARLETKMDKRIYDLYDLRGDLLETAAIAALNERPFYMGNQLAEIDQQIKILESITPEAQAFYFDELLDTDYHDLKATQEAARP